MTQNLLLVINPTAGSVNVNDVVAQAKFWTATLHFELEVYNTTGKNDKDEIERLLKSKPFKRIITAGGDGTVNMVASVILDTDIILGILACGSANGLATSLAIPNQIDQQFELALTQHFTAVDTLIINDKLCLHIADVGINAELIYNYEASKSSGMLGYAMHVLPTLFQSDYPYKFKLETKDKTIERKGVLLAFANAKKYGTGATINPKGKINDGLFEVIIFKRLSFLEILKSFIKHLPVRKSSAEIYPTKAVAVTCKKPIALQVDGEFIGEFNSFSAHINSNSLRLALPE